jgi:RimJ/RimL family protein N-acetyltransferase
MFIRSERLFLRPAWAEDWADVLAAISDEAVLRNLARAPWPYRAEDAQWFVNRPQDLRCPDFLVTLPGMDGAHVIGCAGMASGEDGTAEIGYWIARSHWGRGFATEAARAVLDLFAREDPDGAAALQKRLRRSVFYVDHARLVAFEDGRVEGDVLRYARALGGVAHAEGEGRAVSTRFEAALGSALSLGDGVRLGDGRLEVFAGGRVVASLDRGAPWLGRLFLFGVG